MTRSAALQQLVSLVREVTGNVVPPARHAFLEELAERRAHAAGLPAAAWVEALAAGALDAEWELLIPLITIKESYFFRAPQQFEAIVERLLPELLVRRAEVRQLRVWSAACARGEEPATLAMLLAEHGGLAGWEWSILATDVDRDALIGARGGLYGERAVAQVPPALLERWFTRRGKLFELSPELRSRILYRHLNLAHPPFSLPYERFDLILLRNVLIYFRRPLQRWVTSQVAQALAPDGSLFLGASETLWQIQDELEAVDLGACFCYRHRTTPKLAAVPAAGPAEPEPAPRRAEPKPAAPKPVPPPLRPAPTPPPAPAPRVVVQPCGIQERLAGAARDLAENRVAEAARQIAEVLVADPGEPAAHALEGFLHDLAGRADEAVASYRAALYLDPTLYQVRLLLADCLLRLGHRDRAEGQFREVLAFTGNGRGRALLAFEGLPVPDRDRAERRARQVLRGG